MAAPDALYTAVAAVAVAVVGVVGNIVTRRQPGSAEDEARELETDLDLMKALASAWKEEAERRVEAERRLAACEAREKARRHATD